MTSPRVTLTRYAEGRIRSKAAALNLPRVSGVKGQQMATERPRLASHLAAIRESIARIAGVELTQVNVKAKSGEGLDAIGHGEAIGATAVVLLGAAPRS